MVTVRERIMKMLSEQGIEEAVGVTVQFRDGLSVTIHSDSHPALDRDAAEMATAAVTQTAEGGL